MTHNDSYPDRKDVQRCPWCGSSFRQMLGDDLWWQCGSRTSRQSWGCREVDALRAAFVWAFQAYGEPTGEWARFDHLLPDGVEVFDNNRTAALRAERDEAIISEGCAIADREKAEAEVERIRDLWKCFPQMTDHEVEIAARDTCAMLFTEQGGRGS